MKGDSRGALSHMMLAVARKIFSPQPGKKMHANGFRLVTWNVLATAYIRTSFYPRTERQFLEPSWRHRAIVARARALDADVLCLQEVEAEVFEALQAELRATHAGELAMKTEKPDGCATFVRASRFRIDRTERVAYEDGSGHVAQVVELSQGDERVIVCNTHLKWDKPKTPAAERWGSRQARAALDVLEKKSNVARIACGDLNVTADSDVIALFAEKGFVDAHRGLPNAYTCNSNELARRIDFILARGANTTPQSPRAIDDQTPLPSEDEPSDHLPLGALVFPVT
jgi:endonuclease/exonuclease/phosphatase family metal-dependent hydrolase